MWVYLVGVYEARDAGKGQCNITNVFIRATCRCGRDVISQFYMRSYIMLLFLRLVGAALSRRHRLACRPPGKNLNITKFQRRDRKNFNLTLNVPGKKITCGSHQTANDGFFWIGDLFCFAKVKRNFRMPRLWRTTLRRENSRKTRTKKKTEMIILVT